MDIMPLLDELQTIARNGLHYAQNPYDTERYARLLDLVSQYYEQAIEMPADTVRAHLRAEMGHITPKIGASAAIFDDDGRILLVLRSDNETWCLPCGWSEPNESPMETAVRETKEETGLTVRALQLVEVFTRKPRQDNGIFTQVGVLYWCERLSGELTNSHESLGLGYWPIEDVPVWHQNHKNYALAAHEVWQGRRQNGS